jgi:hypothetical protein
VQENLAYALTQLLHNFGAVAVLGGAAFALWARPLPPPRQTQLARLVALAWAVQIASGAGLGAVSYYYHGELPELHGMAVAALSIKVACAAAGLALALVFALGIKRWAEAGRTASWGVLAALAAVALAAAAFLRWFS